MRLQRPNLTAPKRQEIATFMDRLLHINKHINLNSTIQ